MGRTAGIALPNSIRLSAADTQDNYKGLLGAAPSRPSFYAVLFGDLLMLINNMVTRARPMHLNATNGRTFRVTFQDKLGLNVRLLEADKLSDAAAYVEAEGHLVLEVKDTAHG